MHDLPMRIPMLTALFRMLLTARSLFDGSARPERSGRLSDTLHPPSFCRHVRCCAPQASSNSSRRRMVCIMNVGACRVPAASNDRAYYSQKQRQADGPGPPGRISRKLPQKQAHSYFDCSPLHDDP